MNKTVGEVIICINEIDIRQWSKAPLKPAVYIKIFELSIVLHECCPEQIIGKSEFNLAKTVHKEFAIESYELNVLDYLLKPISFERFLKAINKLDTPALAIIKPSINDSENDAFIYVKSEKKNVKVLLKEILFIESLKDYIKIHTLDKTIITQIQISAIEQRLPDNFLRIHRSFIIAKDKITAYTEHDFEIGKHQIPIGRSYKAVVPKNFN
jgi:two-component system LytT family response regulator